MAITPTLTVSTSAVIPSGETAVLSASLLFTRTGLCLTAVSAVYLTPFTGSLTANSIPYTFEILGGITIPATLTFGATTTTAVSCQLTATNPSQHLYDINNTFAVAYSFTSKLAAGAVSTGAETVTGSGTGTAAISALRDESYVVLVERGRMEILGFN